MNTASETPGFQLESWRIAARSLAPGGLRDAAVEAVNAIEAAQLGLCSWEDAEQHPSFRVLSRVASEYPDDRITANLHGVLHGLASRMSAEARLKRRLKVPAP